MDVYFTDYFHVSEELLDDHGAFNISLVTDLPLFIDPFLLFNSDKPQYKKLHDSIIEYLRNLRLRSERGGVSSGHIKALYSFKEVKQNWLGFCQNGNVGRGLGIGFGKALNRNLVNVFRNFGDEVITKGSHLEKLGLIERGVGRDMISDFTTNLIKAFLLDYTTEFTQKHIDRQFVRTFGVHRTHFSYVTQRWMPKTYLLPNFEGDFVILTPKDILTKDDTWISNTDMYNRFTEIPNSVDNEELRAAINEYFYTMIPHNREPTKQELKHAKSATINRFPVIVDYYIKMQEERGDEAESISIGKVTESDYRYVKQFGRIVELLDTLTPFYRITEDTEKETLEKIRFFQDVIENKGGYKLFYDSHGNPIRHEEDVQILFRFVWHETRSDVSREVNDGRGPADYKISIGSANKTLVEFKLAKNPKLRRNLQNQLETYKLASDATAGFKVIICFTEQEMVRVEDMLKDLEMLNDPNVILIDARNDNKPTGSVA